MKYDSYSRKQTDVSPSGREGRSELAQPAVRDHVEQHGEAFFRVCCEWDLEGVVAKRKDRLYQADRRHSTWVKVKNPTYSQKDGRAELF